ncbi:MAG: S-layer homology domain-containing protein [Lachnospirales bacterium]
MKINKIISITMAFVIMSSQMVYANVGDMGFFTGVSSGRTLPKTTETLNDIVDETTINTDYKELIFLTGEPIVFSGKNEVSSNTTPNRKTEYDTDTVTGTGSASYIVEPYEYASEEDPIIERGVDFDINYYTVGDSTVKDYVVNSWDETITLDGSSYTVDPNRLKYQLSITEQEKPAITYYAGDLSSEIYYVADGDADEVIKVSQVGRIYGYISGYSHTETHRIDVTVEKDGEVYEYQIRPSVMTQKDLIWNDNEPSLISFGGNYREVMSSVAGFSYNVTNKPTSAYLLENEGSDFIETTSTFEQLIPTEITKLKGHWGYSNIQKLFALRILDSNPELYKPDHAITRSDFVDMFVKTLKIEIVEQERSKNAIDFLFPDVTSKRNDYDVIMTAYDEGIIYGKANSAQFYPDEPITREEAITIIMRSLGLDNLGVLPGTITAFTDDSNISSYAKNHVYVAHKIGLITPDSEGKFWPKKYLTKAQAATLSVRLMDYMRDELYTDFSEGIVNNLQ